MTGVGIEFGGISTRIRKNEKIDTLTERGLF